MALWAVFGSACRFRLSAPNSADPIQSCANRCQSCNMFAIHMKSFKTCVLLFLTYKAIFFGFPGTPIPWPIVVGGPAHYLQKFSHESRTRKFSAIGENQPAMNFWHTKARPPSKVVLPFLLISAIRWVGRSDTFAHELGIYDAIPTTKMAIIRGIPTVNVAQKLSSTMWIGNNQPVSSDIQFNGRLARI